MDTTTISSTVACTVATTFAQCNGPSLYLCAWGYYSYFYDLFFTAIDILTTSTMIFLFGFGAQDFHHGNGSHDYYDDHSHYHYLT